MARGGRTSGAGRSKRARAGKSPRDPSPGSLRSLPSPARGAGSEVAAALDALAVGRKKKQRRSRKRRVSKGTGAAAQSPDDGLSPVDIIIGMMRGDLPLDDARFKAAVAAAPYVHARRGTAEPPEEPSVRHEDALKELE